MIKVLLLFLILLIQSLGQSLNTTRLDKHKKILIEAPPIASERKVFFQMAKQLVENGYDVSILVPLGSPQEFEAPLYGIKAIPLKGLREEFLQTIYKGAPTNQINFGE